MQSENNKSENSSPNDSTNEGDFQNHFSPKHLLKREASMPGEDKKNLVWMVAGLCAFAGIGMGFGAGIGVGAMLQGNHCRHQVQMQSSRAVQSQTTSWTFSTKKAEAPRFTWLGVEGRSISGQSGAFILKVFPNSPAEAAGLQRGELITRIDDTPIHRFEDLKVAVQQHQKGDLVNLFYVNEAGQDAMVRTRLSDISKEAFRNHKQHKRSCNKK